MGTFALYIAIRTSSPRRGAPREGSSVTSAEGPEPVPAGRRRPDSTIARRPGARIPVQRRGSHSCRSANVEELTDLARAGTIASSLAAAADAERHAFYAAAYAVCYPVVFEVVTRKVERRRGHARCRRGVGELTGPCLDGF